MVVLLLLLARSLEPDGRGDPAVQRALQKEHAATQETVEPGDIFVTGHIRHSGMFTLRSGETLRSALSAAGGTNTADASELIVELIRKENGKETTLSIPVPDVLSGENDPPIKVGDIVDVVHQAKPTTLPMISAPTPK